MGGGKGRKEEAKSLYAAEVKSTVRGFLGTPTNLDVGEDGEGGGVGGDGGGGDGGGGGGGDGGYGGGGWGGKGRNSMRIFNLHEFILTHLIVCHKIE